MKLLLCMLTLTLTACVPGSDGETARPSPSGPPTIDYDLVRQHALQFDVDIPSRPAGSQHELAAATYMLGHLQLAGYGPLLDPVPVGDQVQSTNVVAFPPNGEDPEILVTVGYAHDGTGPGEGPRIGLFLELARAMNVSDPGHSIGFVALGAGDFGEMKLQRFLVERELDPEVISIPVLEPSLAAVGDELFRSLMSDPD